MHSFHGCDNSNIVERHKHIVGPPPAFALALVGTHQFIPIVYSWFCGILWEATISDLILTVRVLAMCALR